MNDQTPKDWLDQVVAERAATEPGVAEAWKWVTLRHELITARKNAGLTQVELAEKLQVSQSRIVQIEKHPENVSVEGLLKYLNATGATFRIELLTDENQQKAS